MSISRACKYNSSMQNSNRGNEDGISSKTCQPDKVDSILPELILPTKKSSILALKKPLSYDDRNNTIFTRHSTASVVFISTDIPFN
jgi:hypothetical protein